VRLSEVLTEMRFRMDSQILPLRWHTCCTEEPDRSMSRQPSKHIYGPVPSRRLGRSLGVDLVPYKICSYDCIYCQLGRTTQKTIERKEYVPLNDLVEEIGRVTAAGVAADYVTLSGSGEPTLHSGIGRVIAELKSKTTIPVAVLTNGSLLWDAKVRESILQADLIVPSLDAAGPAMFRYVNRPHRDIAFERMLEGLIALRREFKKKIWLEVMLIGGVTAIPKEVEKMADRASRVEADRIQLNTVTRPPAEGFAYAVPREKMEDFVELFGVGAEVIADYAGRENIEWAGIARREVLSLIERRPCALEDIAGGLGIHRNEVLKHVGALEKDGLVAAESRGNRVYYVKKRDGTSGVLPEE
jgi:wyosine [tRNA(Phe)-imidazoG37] synthetase (radical SAM superfamily)